MKNQNDKQNGVYFYPNQTNAHSDANAPQQYAYNTNINPYVKPKKIYNPFEKKDSLFLFLFFIAGFILIDFALSKGFHLGFTISYFIIFILSTVYVKNKDEKPEAFPIICGILSLAASIPFALYYNALINTITVALIVGLFTVYLIGISGVAKRKSGNFKMLFDLFEVTFIKPFDNISDVLGSMKASAKESKKYLSALVGALIAIPVLLVVIPLLVESDAAFEGLVTYVAKNIGIYLIELLGAVIILPYTFSYMFGKKHRLNNTVSKNSKSNLRKLPVSGSVSFLCVISLTYLVYLFSQLAYFFSAFKGFLPKDYSRSASAFARRGFFEMFAICVINVLIISAVSAFSKKSEKGKPSLAIKLMSLFITLFSILLIATAMQKMKLNITTFGFTVNRLLVSILMLMILIVFVFFIIHIFLPRVSYMQPIIIICSVIFIAAGFANLDAVTANHNINIYKASENKYIDVQAIADMGVDTIPQLVELAKDGDKKVSHNAEMKLIDLAYGKYNNDAYVNNYGDFRAFYLSRQKAHKALKAYENEMTQSKKKAYNQTVKMMKSEDYEYVEWDDNEDNYFVNYSENKEYHYNEKTGGFDIVKSVNEEVYGG